MAREGTGPQAADMVGMRQVIAGICTDCGCAAPHAAVHEGWHEQQEALLQTLVAAQLGIVHPGDRVLVTLPDVAMEAGQVLAMKVELEDLFPGTTFVFLQGATDVKVVRDDSEAAAQA